MPAAAPVHAHPVPASAPMRAKSVAKGGEAEVSGSGSAPGAGNDFGKYFREQAGTAAVPAPKGLPGPAAKPASNVTAPALADPELSLPESGILGSPAPVAALPDLPQSAILDQLRNEQHGAAVEIATIAGPQSSGETGSLLSGPQSATESEEAKSTKASSSAKNTHQKGKTETVAQPKNAAPALPVASAPPLAAMPALTSAAPVVPPIPLKPAIAVLEKAQPAGANLQQTAGPASTSGKAVPQSALPQIRPAVSMAQPGAAGASAQPLPGATPVALAGQTSVGDGNQAKGAPNSEAPSRDALPAAPGLHASHVSTMPSTGAPAALLASPAAATHSDAPSAPLPHVVLGPPAAAAPAAGGLVPAGATVLYDRLDQAPAPVVLHSGAQHVSVGVHDPNLGWVEIQTQNSGGHVDAMLVASSGQTHDSLAAQLPALAQFLEQRDVRVGALAVQHPAQAPTTGGGSGGGAGSGGGMGSGTGYAGNGGAGARHSGSANSDGRSTPQSSRLRTASQGAISGAAAGTSSGGEASPYRPLSYISVRA